MKILVMLKDLYIGGIQKSCVNFCNYISSKDNQVDLLVINKNGPLFKDLNEKINIIETSKSFLPFGVSKKQSKEFGFSFFVKRNFIALFNKFFGNQFFLKKALKKQNIIQNEYDVAISFAPSTGTKTMTVGSTELVLQKVNAKKKFVFMHSDFALSGLNNPYAISQMSQFDKIFCVSKSCCQNMQNCLPKLKDKVDYLYNFCNDKEIIEKSKENLKLEGKNNKVNIISVSRLSEEKGFLRSLNVFKKLIEQGQINFCWHILGDGNERIKIEEFIKNNNMQDYVLMYGNKSNPYPYIKQADLFYLGSFHEAAPMVYAEAMLLNVPIITTKTVSALELVGDKGFVCENNEDDIYKEFKDLLTNNNKILDKQSKLKDYRYDNEKIKQKQNDLKDYYYDNTKIYDKFIKELK